MAFFYWELRLGFWSNDWAVGQHWGWLWWCSGARGMACFGPTVGWSWRSPHSDWVARNRPIRRPMIACLRQSRHLPIGKTEAFLSSGSCKDNQTLHTCLIRISSNQFSGILKSISMLWVSWEEHSVKRVSAKYRTKSGLYVLFSDQMLYLLCEYGLLIGIPVLLVVVLCLTRAQNLAVQMKSWES